MKRKLEPVKKRGKIGQTLLFSYLQKKRRSFKYEDTVELVSQYVKSGVLVPIKSRGVTANKDNLAKCYFYNEIISADLVKNLNNFNQIDVSWYLEPKKVRKIIF